MMKHNSARIVFLWFRIKYKSKKFLLLYDNNRSNIKFDPETLSYIACKSQENTFPGGNLFLQNFLIFATLLF